MEDKIKILESLRDDCAKSNKKGLSFIGASIAVWLLIMIIWMADIPLKQANLFTFFATGILMPTAFVVGKIIKVDIFNKDDNNPLNILAFLFTINQVIYLVIPMYAFNFAPEKMLVLFTIVFGAHLFPFSWVYKSNLYKIAAIFIPIVALVVGNMYSNFILSAVMVVVQIIFTAKLYLDTK